MFDIFIMFKVPCLAVILIKNFEVTIAIGLDNSVFCSAARHDSTFAGMQTSRR